MFLSFPFSQLLQTRSGTTLASDILSYLAIKIFLTTIRILGREFPRVQQKCYKISFTFVSNWQIGMPKRLKDIGGSRNSYWKTSNWFSCIWRYFNFNTIKWIKPDLNFRLVTGADWRVFTLFFSCFSPFRFDICPTGKSILTLRTWFWNNRICIARAGKVNATFYEKCAAFD